MREQSNIGWLMGKLAPRDKTVYAIFVTVGMIMIVAGMVVTALGPGGRDVSLLALALAGGLFWITLAYVHAVIAVLRTAEKQRGA